MCMYPFAESKSGNSTLIILSLKGSCWWKWEDVKANARTESLWRRRQSWLYYKESFSFQHLQSEIIKPCVLKSKYNQRMSRVCSLVSLFYSSDHWMSNVCLLRATRLVTSATLWQKKTALSHQLFSQVITWNTGDNEVSDKTL